jgi:hypothetical protein
MFKSNNMKSYLLLFILTSFVIKGFSQCGFDINFKNENGVTLANSYEIIYSGQNEQYQFGVSLSYINMYGKKGYIILVRNVYYYLVNKDYAFPPRNISIYFDDGTFIQIHAETYKEEIKGAFYIQSLSYHLDSYSFNQLSKSIKQIKLYDNRSSKSLTFKLIYANALAEQLACINKYK